MDVTICTVHDVIKASVGIADVLIPTQIITCMCTSKYIIENSLFYFSSVNCTYHKFNESSLWGENEVVRGVNKAVFGPVLVCTCVGVGVAAVGVSIAGLTLAGLCYGLASGVGSVRETFEQRRLQRERQQYLEEYNQRRANPQPVTYTPKRMYQYEPFIYIFRQ